MTSLPKNPQPPTKKSFFQVQTRRLAVSFKHLNSSLPLSAPEYTRAKPCAIRLFWRELLDLDQLQKY